MGTNVRNISGLDAFNKAQTDRWHRADQAEPVPGRPESLVAPVVRQLDRTIDFLDLIGA
ncbi:hypothetical protein ACFZC6_05435 [Streptomyces ossamyceticus]